MPKLEEAVDVLVNAASAAGEDTDPAHLGTLAVFGGGLTHIDPDVRQACRLVSEACTGMADHDAWLAVSRQVETIGEAGGAVSWLFRQTTGLDGHLEREIREEMAKVTTIAQRDQLAKDILGFLEQARSAQKEGLLTGLLKAVGLTYTGAAAGYAVGFGGGFHAAFTDPGKQSLLVRILEKIAPKAAQASRFGTAVSAGVSTAGTVAGGVATAALAAGIIGAFWRAINRVNGKMDLYVETLEQVYKEVKRMKVQR